MTEAPVRDWRPPEADPLADIAELRAEMKVPPRMAFSPNRMVVSASEIEGYAFMVIKERQPWWTPQLQAGCPLVTSFLLMQASP